MSSRIALLGLDIGTTSCKVACYTPEGTRITQAATDYHLSFPQPGWAELDPEAVLSAVKHVFTQVAPDLAGFERLALAISAQGEAFVLVDGDGRALAPAPVSMDTRGLEAITALKADDAAAQAAETAGQELNALTSLAKLLWFRDAPDGPLARADKALCMGEFVMRSLGLNPVIDYSMAARMGLLDIQRRSWSTDLLAAAGLSSDLLPPAAPSGRYVGTIPAERMAAFGLDLAVEVYSGGHDQACAMLGAGVTEAASALYSVGTTEAIAIPAEAISHSLEGLHISPYPHVVEGRDILLFGSQHGGRVLSWLAGLLGQSGTPALLENLPDVPSTLTLVPHLAGSGTVLADDGARGLILGLDYTTTSGSLAFAALEGVTMEQALALQRLKDRGVGITGLRAVGGGTRSDVWMQMKADILGLPIDCLDEPDTACAGAAVLAGLGAGAFTSAEAAAGRFTSVRRRFEPRPREHQVYALKLALYERAYQAAATLRPFLQDVERAVQRLAEERKEKQ
ncbi:FGGY-family carbohydrate kinase [Hyphomonas sp.]|uniref:FGGY-family carbohydrate kinase n=1 Tax=Alphaproteobacteria TaxID=28211 RepID=UPI0032675DBF